MDDSIENLLKSAKMQELLKMRRPQNEFDAAMEIIRPETQSSKKLVILSDGRIGMQSLPYTELVTKESATANFKPQEAYLNLGWGRLSLLCQFITESSDRKIDLSEVQRFDAVMKSMNEQTSKSIEGGYARLTRTGISEARTEHKGYVQPSQKPGIRILPTGQQG